MLPLYICGAYLLLSLILGLATGKKGSSSVTSFVAADRSMNLFVMYFVMGAACFSSFAFLGGPGWAYSRGAAALYILSYGILGAPILYYVGPKVWHLGARLGFVTQAELLMHRFQRTSLSVILAIISVVFFIPYLTLQMKGAAYLLNVISEGMISQALGAGIAYGIVLIYVSYSGMRGVGWTNMLQGIFMMVMAWFLGLYLPNQLYGGVGPMFEQIADLPDGKALLTAPGLTGSQTPWNWWGFSSAILVSATGYFVWPHLFMKSYVAKSPRIIRLTGVLYPTFQVLMIPILFIGFAGIVHYPGVDPSDEILPTLLTQMELSPILVGLVCAGALAASMSSGDTILHAAASIGIRDGLNHLLPRPLSDQQQQRGIRLLVLIIGGIAYFFAVGTEIPIVDLLLGAYGGIAQLAPIIVAGLYWHRATGRGALWGLIAGIVVNMVFLLQPDWKPLPLHEGVYGLVANIAVLISLSLLSPPEPEEIIQHYRSSP